MTRESAAGTPVFRSEPVIGNNPGEWLRSGNESPEAAVSAGTKPSPTAAKGRSRNRSGAPEWRTCTLALANPGDSRRPHFVSTFWIVVKTDGLGSPVAGVKQRLIRRVAFPEKHAENAVRSKRRKFAAHFVTSAPILDIEGRSRLHGCFIRKITIGNIPIQISTSPQSSPSATL